MNLGGTKNSIISFILIVSFILTPFLTIGILNTKKAEAQGLGGVSGYVSGLAPAIAKLPQCQEIIGNKIKGLFNGIGDLFNGDSLVVPEGVRRPPGAPPIKPDYTNFDFTSLAGAPSMEESLSDLHREAFEADLNSIRTNNPKLEKDIDEALKKLNKIEKSTASINANSTCIQSIGRLIIKMLLQKLTVSTVNWINSGFDGSPAFIQDTGKFFNDIAKNEILEFGMEINDSELYPFGKEWLRNTATAFNNKFQDNARYSLNELIQQTTPEYSAITFNEDFSKGGWNAWTALTQVPANNPLGFKVMADNEIQRRLEGTAESRATGIREALKQANGFLGDQRCVDPGGVTREMHDAGLRENPAVILCKKWEYVTPGSLVAQAATNAVNYPNNALLNVEDLNDAVAALLDALLGQFFPWLMEKGFSNLGTDGADGQLYFTDNGSATYRSRTQKDFAPIHLSSSWLAANPEFDIRTDLTQALIDEQRTYSDKLTLQNKELFSTTDGKEYKLNTGAGNTNNNFCNRGLLGALCDQLDFGLGGLNLYASNIWFSDAWPTTDTGTSGIWATGNLYSGTWVTAGAATSGQSGTWTNSTGSGTWTATTGIGGKGVTTWTGAGNGTGTWTSATGSGTWTNGTGTGGAGTGTWTSSTGAGVSNPSGTWSSSDGGVSGTWKTGTSSGTWTATTGTGGADLGNWIEMSNGAGTWISPTGSGSWTNNTGTAEGGLGLWISSTNIGTWGATDGTSAGGTGGTGTANWVQTGSGTGTWTSGTGNGTWTSTGVPLIPPSEAMGVWTPLGALGSGSTNPPAGSGATGTSNAYGLLPVIYQLDYCIPGPHPGWEDDSRRTLAEVMDRVIPETEASLENREAEAITGVAAALAPLAGSALGMMMAGSTGALSLGLGLGAAAGPVGMIIGAAIGAIFMAILGGTSAAEKVMQYYSVVIYGLTGLLPDYENQSDSLAGNISSKNGMVHILNEILSRYAKIMNGTYFSSPEILPPIAREAMVNFNQARGYEQMIVNNENRIALFKTTINILNEIKGKVDTLNGEYKMPDGLFYPNKSETDYEDNLKAQINEFGRVSASMVNGDDIASTDNLLKQIIDKKNYLYNNLLKGQYGCEAFLEKPQTKFQGFGVLPGKDREDSNWSNFDVLSMKRMTYPFPILYEYNNGLSQYGPGFLNFVMFSSTTGVKNSDGSGDQYDRRGPERLYVADLFPHWGREETRNRRLGTFNGCVNCSGPFENIIGIY